MLRLFTSVNLFQFSDGPFIVHLLKCFKTKLSLVDIQDFFMLILFFLSVNGQ